MSFHPIKESNLRPVTDNPYSWWMRLLNASRSVTQHEFFPTSVLTSPSRADLRFHRQGSDERTVQIIDISGINRQSNKRKSSLDKEINYAHERLWLNMDKLFRYKATERINMLTKPTEF
jgi:hypothetical protein